MKHLLMDPAFPDVVGAAVTEPSAPQHRRCDCANDNAEDENDLNDPLLTMLGRMEIAATRLW